MSSHNGSMTNPTTALPNTAVAPSSGAFGLCSRRQLIRPFFWVFYSLLVGILAPKEIYIGGTFFGAEIMLLVALPVLLLIGIGSTKQIKSFRWLLFFNLLMLTGFILSDLVAGTPPRDLLRGWARISILCTNFLALTLLIVQHRQCLWWLALGIGIGKFVYPDYRLDYLSYWKFSLGPGYCYLALTLGALLPRLLGVLPLIGMSIYSISIGARSLGAVGFLSSSITAFIGKQRGLSKLNYVKFLMVGSVSLLLLSGTYLFYLESIKEQRKLSDIGRLHGITMGLQSIMRHPILGAGSWSFTAGREGQDYASTVRDEEQIFGGHSQVIQAWVEGGLLAGIFFLYLLFKILSASFRITSLRPFDLLTNICLFLLIHTAWNIIASPFGGNHRLTLALCMCVICMVENDITRLERDEQA